MPEGNSQGNNAHSDEADDQERRSRDIADTTRKVLVTLNGGGIGLLFAVAGTLADKGASVAWAVWPAGLFVLGLSFILISLFLAKKRAMKRRDAARKDEPEPDLTAWCWRSFTWDLLSFISFGLGAILAILSLSCAATRLGP